MALKSALKSMAIGIAQANHRLLTRALRRNEGLPIDAAIPPLDEDKSLRVAARLFRNLCLFTMVAGRVVISVDQRRSRKQEFLAQELKEMIEKAKLLAQECEEKIDKAELLAQLFAQECEEKIEKAELLAQEYEKRKQQLEDEDFDDFLD